MPAICDHFPNCSITNYSISGVPSIPSIPCNLPFHYKQHQLEQFKLRLSDTSWEFFTDSSWSVGNLFNQFCDFIKEAFVDSSFATSDVKSSKCSVPRAPWMFAALLNGIKRNTYLWKAFKSSSSHHHLEK